MPRYARDCLAVSLEVVAVGAPFSNFAFVDERFPRIGWPLRRLLSQLRSLRAQSMVVEELDTATAEDLAEEQEDLGKRFAGSCVSSRVHRLSFFANSFGDARGLESTSDHGFLGYAILKHDVIDNGTRRESGRVYESVLPFSRHANNYVRGAQHWQCQVGHRQFRTLGYLYAQQQGDTNVCAHVACRTVAARFHQHGDMTYREMNELPDVAIDHVSRLAEGGLTSDQIVAILEAAGARCVMADYTLPRNGFTPPEFQRYVYGSVESGFPAIVFFATHDDQHHVIPVFGHTFNEDMWVSNAERSYFRVGDATRYLPSDQWLSTFIAHDDNWGSNFCVPRHFLHTRRFCNEWPTGPRPCHDDSDCVAYVIATLPREVKINPIDAEITAADYLFRTLPKMPGTTASWGDRLNHYSKQGLLVLRPILVKAHEYADHLRKLQDWNARAFSPHLVAALRDFTDKPLWMVEMSIPELFSANRRKLGEVLLLADQSSGPQRDFRSFVLMRVPGQFVVCTGGDATNPNFTFLETDVQSHVALYDCENSP